MLDTLGIISVPQKRAREKSYMSTYGWMRSMLLWFRGVWVCVVQIGSVKSMCSNYWLVFISSPWSWVLKSESMTLHEYKTSLSIFTRIRTNAQVHWEEFKQDSRRTTPPPLQNLAIHYDIFLWHTHKGPLMSPLRVLRWETQFGPQRLVFSVPQFPR